MKLSNDFYGFKRNSDYWRCSITFRVTHENGSHAEFEARGTGDGQSLWAVIKAYCQAKRSQQDLIKKWKTQIQ